LIATSDETTKDEDNVVLRARGV